MSTYLPEDEGFVGPDGQILCRWTELTEPTRVAMTWAWMRTLPDAQIEDRLPRRATLTVTLTAGTEAGTTDLDLRHADIPAEWVEDMTTIWLSKIDQWAYQSRPPRRRASRPSRQPSTRAPGTIELPDDTAGVPVIRTDFRDNDLWAQLRADLIAEDYTGSGYEPNLNFVDRTDLTELNTATLEAAVPRLYPSAYGQPFLVVADATAVSSPEHHVLLIDLNGHNTSPSFRALPQEIATIEANLSTANMDFSNFYDNTSNDGVFRGLA